MEEAAYTTELQAGAPEGRRCAKPAPGKLSSTLHTKPSCSVCCSIAKKTKSIHANLKLGGTILHGWQFHHMLFCFKLNLWRVRNSHSIWCVGPSASVPPCRQAFTTPDPALYIYCAKSGWDSRASENKLYMLKPKVCLGWVECYHGLIGFGQCSTIYQKEL